MAGFEKPETRNQVVGFEMRPIGGKARVATNAPPEVFILPFLRVAGTSGVWMRVKLRRWEGHVGERD